MKIRGTSQLTRRRLILVTAVSIAALSTDAHGTSISEAITGGKVNLDVRYRYEYVSQDNALKDANASTVATRLGYMTGDVAGVEGFIELSNVTAVFGDDYNSKVNNKTQYSVVADPEISVANQAYLTYTGLPHTGIKFGRQRMILDNARFIGNVGWRQTEQTYDGVSLTNSSLPHTKLTYAHLTNANTITGGNNTMHTDIVHGAFTGLPGGTLVAYAYLLDLRHASALSTQTLGARFFGHTQVADAWSALYTAEFAHQSDYGDNPASFNLNYWRAELGTRVHGAAVKAGYEVLGSNGTNSITTPLATLHAMNGWADQFLSTPTQGLEDLYVTLSGSVRGVGLTAVYHSFKPNKGGGDFGSEWDVSAKRPINKIYTVLLKYAGFRTGNTGGKVDTDKVWLMGRVKF
jgi:uncharacterized protein YjbI with pentapeptide repeats